MIDLRNALTLASDSIIVRSLGCSHEFPTTAGVVESLRAWTDLLLAWTALFTFSFWFLLTGSMDRRPGSRSLGVGLYQHTSGSGWPHCTPPYTRDGSVRLWRTSRALLLPISSSAAWWLSYRLVQQVLPW